MIKHIIRQEKNGGYWFIVNEGKALELTDDDYQLLFTMYNIADGNNSNSSNVNDSNANDSNANRVLFSALRKYQLIDDSKANREIFTTLEKHQLINPIANPAPWQQEVRLIQSDLIQSNLPSTALFCEHAYIAPKRIYFEITRLCNLRCRSCFNNSKQQLPHELTLEEIIDVNRQAAEIGVFEIRYTGGECTLLPYFNEIISDAKKRGIYISLGTNGIYTEEQLKWLPQSGVDWFIISLDGDRQTNDKVRGAGTFDKVVNTLQHLAQLPQLRVRLNMVVAKHNVKEIVTVAEIAAKYSVSSINLIPMRPYGRSLTQMENELLTKKDFYNFIHEINRLRKIYPQIIFSTTIDLLDPDQVTSHDFIVQKKKTCAAGIEACVIGPQGHVYGCSYSPASFPEIADELGKKYFIAGNIRENSLKEIWRDDARWQVFRNLNMFKNEKCKKCLHYTVRCSGSCQIMSYYQMDKSKNATEKSLGEYLDPYCFEDIFNNN